MHSGQTPRHIASRSLILLNFASSFLRARRWRPRARSGAVLRRGPPSRARASSSAKHLTPIWEIRLADQRTTWTVLPERRSPAPLSKACRPSASGKVWLITVRNLPVRPVRQPGQLAGVRLDDEEHGVDLVPARQLLVRGRAQGDPPAALAHRPYEPSSTAPPTVPMTTSNPPAAGPGRPAPALRKRSAPRSRTKPASVLRPVAATWPPRMAASWTATMPTPPAPPWTSTCSPGSRAAWSTSACQAVSAASGSAAAATWETECGLAARLPAALPCRAPAIRASPCIRPTRSRWTRTSR